MKLSTEPYKGVRDFYPHDKQIQTYIFNMWREVVEQYGYVEYDASVLEPRELYEAKSGEDIVNHETYSFTDRGNRNVTLRPEMTPTVARMIAQRQREIVFPARWYSIPNLFRYERPQRGRLREHWQLNVDLFGDESLTADKEIISIGFNILTRFGVNPEQFEIRINDRRIVQSAFAELGLDEETSYALQKLIDKKDKISDFAEKAEALLGKPFEYNPEPNQEIVEIIKQLKKDGISNVYYDPTLMRGFDYYTGIVFEFFDKHPDNNRSLFGGGRYDNLLDIFESKRISAVGFGAGDVGIQHVLETYKLIPHLQRSTIGICALTIDDIPKTESLATEMRKNGCNVAINTSLKKPSTLLNWSEKSDNRFTLFIGETERMNSVITIRENIKKKSITLPESELISWLKKA
jgi:histidyl-tRNA synthetase